MSNTGPNSRPVFDTPLDRDQIERSVEFGLRSIEFYEALGKLADTHARARHLFDEIDDLLDELGVPQLPSQL